jgi:hypothetical protein
MREETEKGSSWNRRIKSAGAGKPAKRVSDVAFWPSYWKPVLLRGFPRWRPDQPLPFGVRDALVMAGAEYLHIVPKTKRRK